MTPPRTPEQWAEELVYVVVHDHRTAHLAIGDWRVRAADPGQIGEDADVIRRTIADAIRTAVAEALAVPLPRPLSAEELEEIRLETGQRGEGVCP